MNDCFEKAMSESQVDGGTESIDSRAPATLCTLDTQTQRGCEADVYNC